MGNEARSAASDHDGFTPVFLTERRLLDEVIEELTNHA